MLSLTAALFAVLTGLLYLLLLGSSLATARHARRFGLPRGILLCPPDLFVRVTLIVVSFILAGVAGVPPLVLIALGGDWWLSLAFGLASGAALHVVVLFAGKVAERRYGEGVWDPAVALALLPERASQWLPTAGALLVAAFFEELFFRGLLIGVVAEWIVVGLLVPLSSLMFGALHLVQGRFGVVVSSGVGLALAGLYVWQGGLLAPTAAHWLLNLLQLREAAKHEAELMARMSGDRAEDDGLEVDE